MKKILAIIFLFNSYSALAQDRSGKDSTAFLDSIMNEMDDIIDQLAGSRSFFSVSMGAGTGFFNFKSSSASQLKAQKKLMLSPTISYFHKSGLGISATGFGVFKNGLNPYQLSLTPSYDYIQRGRFTTGIAFSKYFTKQVLSFYATPIQNEISAYFNYKQSWIQPGIALAYGWGTHTEFRLRELDILGARRIRDPRLITIRSEQSVRDLSMLLSVRHDFDWMSLFITHDLLTITPVILLSSGTQNFGFNTSFSSRSKVANNFLPGNQYISDRSEFAAQSASLVIKADYSVGKVFIQPQFLLDYYLHPAKKRLNNAIAVIVGVNF